MLDLTGVLTARSHRVNLALFRPVGPGGEPPAPEQRLRNLQNLRRLHEAQIAPTATFATFLEPQIVENIDHATWIAGIKLQYAENL